VRRVIVIMTVEKILVAVLIPNLTLFATSVMEKVDGMSVLIPSVTVQRRR